MRKSKEYVSNKELYKEMIVSLNMGKLTPRAQQMLILMIHRFSASFWFESEELREHCVSTCYEHLFSSWIHYDLEYENAFAYFSQGIKRGIYSGWYSYYEFVYKDNYKRERVKFLRYNNMESDYL